MTSELTRNIYDKLFINDVTFSHFEEIVEELRIFGKVIVHSQQIPDIITCVFLSGNVQNSHENMPATTRTNKERK